MSINVVYLEHLGVLFIGACAKHICAHKQPFLFISFQVTKRDEDSSLMQLKEEFRSYEALRREHDAQIVHIAMEAGLRISPEQWSSLLYGDLMHKSHMQSIIDKVLHVYCINH